MTILSHFRATPESVTRMRQDVLFEHDDNAQRYTKFWALMILSSALAAAGILTESVAALIGAMIVSPFITPMTGVMLAAVLTQRVNMLRSLGLVVAGAAAAVAVGFLLGLTMDAPVSAGANALVAGRVVPIGFDLLVGAMTGIVAAIALVREDISNSVPGVAIAVTLISALAVTGLLLESGAYAQAWDAMVLFGANASATLAAGTLTMALCGVRGSMGLARADDETATDAEAPRHGDRSTWSRVIVMAIVAIVIAAPLTVSAVQLADEQGTQDSAREVAREWADGSGVEFVDVDASGELLTLDFEGPTPLPSTASLADALRREGVDPADVEVRLTPVTTRILDGEATPPQP